MKKILVLSLFILSAWRAPAVHALSWHESTVLFPKNPAMTVCWTSAAAATQFDYHRWVIQNAVMKTWARVANITFSGWGLCSSLPDTTQAIRIDMVASSDGVETATTFGVGTGALKTSGGVSVWFQVNLTNSDEDRVRYLAVHEFGHVLGFHHEHDSPQRDRNCTSSKPWAGIVQVGPWDRYSIMNPTCNPYGNSLGYLSPGDVAAVRQVYGNRKVKVNGDFSGDGTTDWGLWSPTDGVWRLWDDSDPDNGTRQIADQQWGTNGDIPVPADFTGDGKSEYAVWRPSTKSWYILGLSGGVWGEPGDSLVAADYNGDGSADRAVWRPSNQTWYVADGVTPQVVWGQSGDVAVPGDYDGDGAANIAVWRPSTGEWFIRSGGPVFGRYNVGNLGASGDIPVPGDYLGEGKIRPAVFRPSTGEWLFAPGKRPAHLPAPVTLPVQPTATKIQALPGDYDGNGITEPALWECIQTTSSPCTFRLYSGFNQIAGVSGDTALPR